MLNTNDIIIHALIPARGGSKSILNKNIQIYKDYPLLVHSILSAKQEKMISKVVVSTDCKKIQKIAKSSVAYMNLYCSGDYMKFNHVIKNKDNPTIILNIATKFNIFM